MAGIEWGDRMKAKLLGLVAVLSVMLFYPVRGDATTYDETYDYTGNALVVNVCYGEPGGEACDPPAPYPLGISLSTSVTFVSDTYYASGTFDVAADGFGPDDSGGTVTLTSGVITSWLLSGSFEFSGSHGGEVLEITSTPSGDTWDVTYYTDPNTEPPPTDVAYVMDASSSPGTWSCPCAPTPLPAALPLVATGFGVIGLFGWRRKKRKDIAAGYRAGSAVEYKLLERSCRQCDGRDQQSPREREPRQPA